MAKRIPLTQGQFAIVDDEDFKRIDRHRWHAWWSKCTGSYYAIRHQWRDDGRCRTIRMHHAVLRRRCRTDHHNGDTLDNQKFNLRPASRRQNTRNAKCRVDNRLGLKGVRLATPESRTYQARIRIKGRTRVLGSFRTRRLAAIAYDEAAIQHFGEFARLNFPRRARP